MAEPVDEFERILREANSGLDGIRLEIPAMEDGRSAPATAQTWAVESLDPPPPVVAVSNAEVVPLRVRNVEPPPPVPPAAPNQAKWPACARHGLIAAAAVLAAGVGLWWSMRAPEGGTVVLPVASFDAIAARDDDAWLVSRQAELVLFGPSSEPRALAQGAGRLTSIFWADGKLYGLDGNKALFLWETLSAAPRTFSLDHVPLAVYARPPNVWTLDAKGSLRQFILAASMMGVFLQQLDLVEIHHSGDFSVSADGSLLLLERSSGELLRLARDKAGYAVTARGAAYRAGARLLPSERGLWIATADGKSTAIVRVPPP